VDLSGCLQQAELSQATRLDQLSQDTRLDVQNCRRQPAATEGNAFQVDMRLHATKPSTSSATYDVGRVVSSWLSVTELKGRQPTGWSRNNLHRTPGQALHLVVLTCGQLAVRFNWSPTVASRNNLTLSPSSPPNLCCVSRAWLTPRLHDLAFNAIIFPPSGGLGGGLSKADSQ